MPFPNFAEGEGGGGGFAVYARYCITSSLGDNEALSFVFLYMLEAFQDSFFGCNLKWCTSSPQQYYRSYK